MYLQICEFRNSIDTQKYHVCVVFFMPIIITCPNIGYTENVLDNKKSNF